MNEWTLRTAEFVLPGHPDKLADAIADAIVEEARSRERRALVGVEVALHRDVVFIDGRVACEAAEEIDFERIARDVHAEVGYCDRFPPEPRDLKVITDLCLGPLLDDETEFREVADDQSIVTGYACSTPGTDHLPVEHALAGRLARALHALRNDLPDLRLGPDGKLIVFVEESKDGRRFQLEGVSVSVQHASDWDAVRARRTIDELVRREISALALDVPGFDAGREFDLRINGAGDFVEGGPFGDNGLSGKKLVIDFYGPRVPIGGGALSGKDFWKADRAGAIVARRLAVAAVERLGIRECTVTLGITPGDTEFRIVRACTGDDEPVDPARIEGLADASLASVESWPEKAGRLADVARFGHFADRDRPPVGVPESASADQAAAGSTAPFTDGLAGDRVRARRPQPEYACDDGNVYRLSYEPPLKWTLLRRNGTGTWSADRELDFDALQEWIASQTASGNERVRSRLGLPSRQSIRGTLAGMSPPALLVHSGDKYYGWGFPGNGGRMRTTREYWAQETADGSVTLFLRDIPPIGWNKTDCPATRGAIIASGIESVDELEEALQTEVAGARIDRVSAETHLPGLLRETADNR